jgi:predicted nucleotidyltransferase
MDFRHPLGVVTPTLDGDILAVLARADEGFSGRQLHRLVGHASEPGVRKAAERLVEQGIVVRQQIGRAKVYRLNRQHVAAPYVEGLAALRGVLIDRLRGTLDAWKEPPMMAALFGSVARGEATPGSDLDLLLVRRGEVSEESPVWQEQVSALEQEATEWTGNDARVLEYAEEELAISDVAGLVEGAIAEGVLVFGSRRRLRQRLRGEGR